MSVEHSAHVYVGYELRDGWEDIVPQEYIDEHEDKFIHLNAMDGDILLFAVDVLSVDCGDYAEMRHLNIEDEETEILNYFPTLFPKAVENHTPKYFLAGRIH